MVLKGNCIMAQSGGPTAVINSSICGIIQEALKHDQIEGIYGALNGILGILHENIMDLRQESKETIEGLRHTPSSALGSCRYKLKEEDYDKAMKIFTKYNIRYFFYAGGNDSMDTANKISKLAQERNYELRVIGVPKTVDNDLRVTDHCPGYGSVIRHNAIAIRDAGRDTEAIGTTDKVKIVETMGRNTGWIAAGSALAREQENDAPHLIYLPERPTIIDKLLNDVQKVYDKLGYCLIAASEGLVDEQGEPLSTSASKVDLDGFGHKQYGGVGEFLANVIKEKLELKARTDKPATMQRSAGDRVSSVDEEEAYRAGQTAVQQAVEGKSDCMVALIREEGKEYRCRTELVPLHKIANERKEVPDEYISPEGNDMTRKFIDYAKPLMGGSLHPYVRLKKVFL